MNNGKKVVDGTEPCGTSQLIDSGEQWLATTAAMERPEGKLEIKVQRWIEPIRGKFGNINLLLDFIKSFS